MVSHERDEGPSSRDPSVVAGRAPKGGGDFAKNIFVARALGAKLRCSPTAPPKFDAMANGSNSSDQALVDDAPSEPEDDAASEPIGDAPSESDSEPIDDEEPVDVIVKNQVAVTSEAVKRARRRLRGKGASMDEDERFEFMISVIAVFVVTVFCLVPGFISMVLTMVIGVPVYLAYTFATSRVGMLLIAGAAGWFLAMRHRPAGLKRKSE